MQALAQQQEQQEQLPHLLAQHVLQGCALPVAAHQSEPRVAVADAAATESAARWAQQGGLGGMPEVCVGWPAEPSSSRGAFPMPAIPWQGHAQQQQGQQAELPLPWQPRSIATTTSARRRRAAASTAGAELPGPSPSSPSKRHHQEKASLSADTEPSSPGSSSWETDHGIPHWRASVRSNVGSVMLCQVPGCGRDLFRSKDYHQRHRICEQHFKAPQVGWLGVALQLSCHYGQLLLRWMPYITIHHASSARQTQPDS